MLGVDGQVGGQAQVRVVGCCACQNDLVECDGREEGGGESGGGVEYEKKGDE